MKLIEILKSSLATMRLNGRRTFLTMIGIIIGIAAVITIMSLGNGYQKATLDSLTDDEEGRVSQIVNFTPNDFDQFMASNPQVFKNSDFQLMRTIDGVEDAMIQEPKANVGFYPKIKIGHDEETEMIKTAEDTHDEIVAGRNLNRSDSDNLMRYATIHQNLATRHFSTPEEALNQTIQIDGVTYTIVGVYAVDYSKSDDENATSFTIGEGEPQAKVPVETNNTFGSTKNQNSYAAKVFLRQGVDAKKVMEEVVKKLNEEGSHSAQGSYSYFDTSEMLKSIGNVLNMITYFVTAVAAISLLIAGVGVMNMMYISVSERIQEIGIRRSLGATQSSIQQQFLFEGIAITTLGGVIGYILGITIAQLVSLTLPFKALVQVSTAILAVAIAVIIGIIFSVFPARSAAKKNVVEILR